MSKVMKIITIRKIFADEWVAAEVTKVDKADVPLAGVVITHSPDKQEVYRAAQAYLAQCPTARTFIFFTGDPIPEGVGVALAFCEPDQGTSSPWRSAVSTGQSAGTRF